MYVTAGGDAAVSARAHGSLVSGVLYTACASWLVKVMTLLLIEYLSKAAIRVDISPNYDVERQLVAHERAKGQREEGRRGREVLGQGYGKVRVEEVEEIVGGGIGNDLESGEGHGDIEMFKSSMPSGVN